MPLQKDWSNFMALSENKADYPRFPPEELITQVPDDKEIVTSGGFIDEQNVRSSNPRTNINHLKSNHEEADTCIILHDVNYSCHTFVSCRDTDVLVLLVSHFHKIQCNELWVKAGKSKNQKYIPVHHIVNRIPPNIIPALIPFHAITHCDTTSYIYGHTKSTAWKIDTC